MAIRKDELARLSGSEDYADYILQARLRFEKGQATTVEELRKVYRRAAEWVRKDIEGLIPGTLRRSHLEALTANLERRARELNAEVLTATQKGIYLAIETGTSAAQNISARLLKEAWSEVEIARLFAPINERAIMLVLARAGKDGLKLSGRVWRVGEHWRNAITRIVEDGVARGLDSRKIAREVQKYLQPGVWTPHKFETRRRLGVPKDVSYEAMRLARTEMNNAFHEASIMANRAAPSYRGVYWRLSKSHPIPDTCDDLANAMTFGERGFYPEGHEPPRPHPQCRCFVIPAHEDPDRFAERLKQWVRDPQSQPDIEVWYTETAKSILERPGRSTYSIPSITDSLYAVLKAKEDEIANRATEKAYLLDKTGKIILEKEGGESSVTFTAEELKLFRDKILTHNHPSSASFSWSDIKLAIHSDLAEVRAVGNRFMYSAQKIKQWPDIKNTAEVAQQVHNEVYQELLDEILAGKLTPEEADFMHWHIVWSRVSKKVGFIYKRSKR